MIRVEQLIEWLMDSPTPSIRYLTLRRLLGRDEDDADVQAARAAMSTTGPIPQILASQTAAGHWEGDATYYGRKYTGTHWSMILLAELSADPNDPRLRRGVEWMLEATRGHHMLEDRFDASVPSPAQFGFTCFWGDILYYAVRAGFADDPRLEPIVAHVARNLDEGGCQCHINDYLPCAWGAVRSLWGLAALPHKSDAVSASIEKALGFLLDPGYPLAQGAYPTPGKVHSMWADLNFPLFYQVDVLFTLRILAHLNALGRTGVQPALDWLEAKRLPNGRWKGISPYRSRTWKIFGDSQDCSRWVSLHAAYILQQAEHQRAAA